MPVKSRHEPPALMTAVCPVRQMTHNSCAKRHSIVTSLHLYINDVSCDLCQMGGEPGDSQLLSPMSHCCVTVPTLMASIVTCVRGVVGPRHTIV